MIQYQVSGLFFRWLISHHMIFKRMVFWLIAAPKTDMKDGKKLKQTTLDTAVSKKRPTKKKGSDDESSFDSADLSEDDEESIVLDDDDDDEDFVKPVVLPKKVRGAATRPIDVDGDDSELSEPPKKAAKVVGGNEAGKEAVVRFVAVAINRWLMAYCNIF